MEAKVVRYLTVTNLYLGNRENASELSWNVAKCQVQRSEVQYGEAVNYVFEAEVFAETRLKCSTLLLQKPN